MTAGPVTRFAPSPSGLLHLGHAYSAVQAHDVARAADGRFLLRIDDIDAARSRPEFVDAALEDLHWLGLDWDGAPVFQSDRIGRYDAALQQLRERGLAYPCFCTRADIAAEIAASGAAPHGPSAHIYPGTCRNLGAAGLARIDQGEDHCWRLDAAQATANAGPLHWHDRDAGAVPADPLAAGDIVLARKDAPSSYHLASTLDDAALGVTHIVRGADLFDATHVQRLLQALFDWPVPDYTHHPLVMAPDGRRLAKRDRPATLATLRKGGTDGRALAGALRNSRLPAGYSFDNA